MTALAIYDEMVRAIGECARVDEVKDIRDKAQALEAYYRQARNLEAEREAANVRLRAERRAGELLKDLARADYNRGNQYVAASNDVTQPSPFAEALADTGMSRQTAHRYQALASVPKDVFEEALSGPDRASTAGVLARSKLRETSSPQPQVSDDALWVWGRLRDFENRGYFRSDARTIFSQMTPAMRADVFRLAPLVSDFLSDLEAFHDAA